MKFADIPPNVIETLKTWRYDRIIEKHEGPESWASYLTWGEPDLLDVGDHIVLLPRAFESPQGITVIRWYPSPDGNSLTVFINDQTLGQWYGDSPESLWAGFLVVADRIGDSEFFAAVVYHEWFIVENSPAAS